MPLQKLTTICSVKRRCCIFVELNLPVAWDTPIPVARYLHFEENSIRRTIDARADFLHYMIQRHGLFEAIS